jgi:peroxin-6
VTNVDCDPPSINDALNPSDIHLGLSAGELGCWVDAPVTRVISTGFEHARIPDASTFLSAQLLTFFKRKGTNALCKGPKDTLDSDSDTATEAGQGNLRAFMQLLGLSQAALMPEALTFDIPISALLKGSRGIGKFSTAVQVARRLGMHVFEVGIRCLCGCNLRCAYGY